MSHFSASGRQILPGKNAIGNDTPVRRIPVSGVIHADFQLFAALHRHLDGYGRAVFQHGGFKELFPVQINAEPDAAAGAERKTHIRPEFLPGAIQVIGENRRGMRQNETFRSSRP